MTDNSLLFREKKIAAVEALKHVKDGDVVGLGTGSTAELFIRELGKKVAEGLRVRGVPSSIRTGELARNLGIEIMENAELHVDVDVDGADELDLSGNMIKGGGGALLREKIVASSSAKVVIIVDHTKVSPRIGKVPLPVEISPFMAQYTLGKIRKLCNDSNLRDGGNYVTDNGNLIADCNFRSIADPQKTLRELKLIPGVVEVGIFIGLCSTAIIGKENKVEILEFQG